VKTLYWSPLSAIIAPTPRRQSFGRTLSKLKRTASLLLAIFVATLSPVAIPKAMAQTLAPPNGGFIYFSLAPGESTAPIKLPIDVPWHVGASTYLGHVGVSEVEIQNQDNNLLEWVGLNSPTGTIASGETSAAGVNIVQIDDSGYVHLVTSSTVGSFVVTNSGTYTQTGNVTWTGFSNAINNPQNTALGVNALYANLTDSTAGSYNTASGYEALFSNTAADYNTASGYQALYKNNGSSNTASGYQVLVANTSGVQNTATGVHALASNTSGSNNIAEGWHGGYNLTTGSNNIDIGSPGVAAESGVIRIGTITGMTSTQSATYVAGIYGKTSGGGLPVVINSNGLLGTTTSSARFKTAIEPMGSNTVKLQQLRPVTFHLKSDPNGALQYGLIAEEVATIYPELVVRDANGRIDGVRYDELAPMLLNEVQKQQRRMASQDERIASQAAEIRDLNRQQKVVVDMQGQLAKMHAALVKLQTNDDLVAQR
jgi:Chaperone of endosialidase